MKLNDVKRNVIQKGIRLGIVNSNRVQRLKNFMIEKKSVTKLTIIKLFSAFKDEDRINMYYDFKESLTIMKALRLEIKKRTLTSDKINGQKSIDEMSFDYRQSIKDLMSLYLVHCRKTINNGEYKSEVACNQIQKVITRNKHISNLLEK